MKMKTNNLLKLMALSGAALLGAIVPGGHVQAAQLMGDHLRVSWALPNMNTRYAGFSIGGQSLYSFHVTNGVEGTAYLNPGGQFTLDVADRALTLGFVTDLAFVAHAFNGLVFEELDGSLFPELSSVEGLAASAISANANKLFINLRARQYKAGEKVVLNFVREVPEPGTWAMMLVGFGVLGAAIRMRPGKIIPLS